MNKSDFVIYCDDKGREHRALVSATNPFHPHHLSLVYVDESLPESANVVKKIDVTHFSRINEPNPNLPTYHLNCWKEYNEYHTPLPSDHPAYDHPHQKVTDEKGNVIPISRPEYEGQVAAHQSAQQASSQADGYGASNEGEPSVADLDAVAAEQKAAEATSGADPAPSE